MHFIANAQDFMQAGESGGMKKVGNKVSLAKRLFSRDYRTMLSEEKAVLPDDTGEKLRETLKNGGKTEKWM